MLDLNNVCETGIMTHLVTAGMLFNYLLLQLNDQACALLIFSERGRESPSCCLSIHSLNGIWAWNFFSSFFVSLSHHASLFEELCWNWLLLPPAARKSNYLHFLRSSALLAFMALSSTVVKWDVQGKAFYDSCYPKSENVPKWFEKLLVSCFSLMFVCY